MIRMVGRKALVVGSMMALLSLGVFSSSAVADMNPHVTEAIAHAEGAAKHGGEGHADALVTHAEEALTHAQAAQKDVQNPHLDEGVSELEAAIEHGKQGHADVGTKHANSAVMHMKEVH
ncbi:small metal-binding protein SmbP [Nitrospira sp. M1]